MELDFAFLADSAEVLGGKIYALGGAFDMLGAPNVPVNILKMTLVMRFLLTPAEANRKHKLEIVVINEDGKKMAVLGGDFSAAGSASVLAGTKLPVPLAFNFLHLKFENFGSYSFEILVNGSSIKSIPLRVAQTAVSPQN